MISVAKRNSAGEQKFAEDINMHLYKILGASLQPTDYRLKELFLCQASEEEMLALDLCQKVKLSVSGFLSANVFICTKV